MNARILLVEDAPDVQMIVGDLLTCQGHDVVVTGDGEDGLRLIGERAFDVLILDVMLPGRDGFELCASARDQGFDGGILMLTARGEVTDRVQGLRTGADDYLAKPFDPNELLARLDALLRRVGKQPLTPVARFQFGDVTVDFKRREVLRGGIPVPLAAQELRLLRHLIHHRGQVLSRESILASLWGDQPFIGPRTVDVHIARLRQKLERKPQSPRYIVTARGEGYCFET